MALRNGIKKVQLGSGAVRYQVRRWVTGADGKRRQLTRNFATAREAGDFLDELQAAGDRLGSDGTPAPSLGGTDARDGESPQGPTVAEAVTAWLAAQRIRETTAAAYEAALAPLVARHGDEPVQSVQADQIEQLIADLRDGKGPGGRRWARTSINPMLARTKAIWQMLEERGRVGTTHGINSVKPLRKRDDPDAAAGPMDTRDRLTPEEIARVVRLHRTVNHGLFFDRDTRPIEAAERRAVFVRLALLGLRRAELAGLRWSDVLLHEDGTGTLRVGRLTRVVVSGRKDKETGEPAAVFEQPGGKSDSAARTLPLPESVVKLLREQKKRSEQIRRNGDFSGAWQGERDGHVIALDNGAPVAPRTLNDWWRQALVDSRVEPRRLHASRHTSASQLIAAGLSPAQVAAWLGHADGGVLALRVYSEVLPEELDAAAAALG